MEVRQIRGGWLTVNRGCNLRCQWCYQQGSEFDSQKTLDKALGYKLVAFMAEAGLKRIIFIGGEPTIYPHLLEMIYAANKQDMETIVVSNGLRLADKRYCRALKKEAHLSSVTISLKAVTDEQYRELTTVAAFQKIRQGIANAREVELRTDFETAIMAAHLERLPDLCAMLKENEIKSINFNLGSPTVSKEGITVPCIPNPRQLGEAVTKLHNILKHTSINYLFTASIPLCMLQPQVLSELKERKAISRSCHMTKGTGLVFDEAGRVLPCNHFGDQPLLQYGVDFITPDEFYAQWVSQPIQQFRSIVNRYPSMECQYCDLWKECGGGCFVKWLYWKPEDYIRRVSMK